MKKYLAFKNKKNFYNHLSSEIYTNNKIKTNNFSTIQTHLHKITIFALKTQFPLPNIFLS
jgi:hypothetical protein